VAVTPGFHGGIEFPNHVMQAPGSAARSVVHEVAHQWFYSLVGNDQARDPWLDEGLASYVEFVQRGSLDQMAARAIPSSVRGHAADPMTFWEGRDSTYYVGVYVQGAVAVSSLGPVDRVDCALRAYVARNAFRIATPADLLAALTPAFPDAEATLAAGGVTIRR
jgi:aminopeptidase N